MTLYKVSKFGRDSGLESKKIGEARKVLKKLGDGYYIHIYEKQFKMVKGKKKYFGNEYFWHRLE